ncbi:hypothetical protein G6F68_009334 [Rhizopus microsporus]|nr:hypothetical protein G6F68_009334 [Rhizopus microsporus]
MATDLHAQVSASLMRPEQRSLRPMQWPAPPKLVALYFGADWCAPCHAFVPTLRSVRDALREAGADTEVVYVSLDESEAALRRYMRAQAMPWPVLDPRRARRMPALQALAGLAPPNRVLIDADGKVLANGWQGRRYEGLQPVLKQWTKQAVAPQGGNPPPPAPPPRRSPTPPPAGHAPAVGAGCRVKAPFGNRELVGVVVGHGQAADGQGLRQALAWCDPQALLQGELWQSLQWLARYTHAPLGEVLSTALPGPLRHGEALPETHHWGWQLTHEGRAQREKLRAGSRPRQLAELLAEAVVDEDVLGERMDDWRTAARSLAKRELAERVALSVAPQHAQPLPGPTLNPDQAEAVAAINAADGFQPRSSIAWHRAGRRWCWCRKSA